MSYEVHACVCNTRSPAVCPGVCRLQDGGQAGGSETWIFNGQGHKCPSPENITAFDSHTLLPNGKQDQHLCLSSVIKPDRLVYKSSRIHPLQWWDI